ncbi:hypothetical protein [Paractinoplanes toevensis]|uniref:Lipoprotein n=1 Tax=Paractinoplanes toevensis TaxID=571911 RepID=A0A919W068_9ACTN|nr:hypothetical protein [Actinoplanes toevensis]GIM88849.1 hypothetical protein Ato02nite_006420 [Actinoplanes toevensis]
MLLKIAAVAAASVVGLVGLTYACACIVMSCRPAAKDPSEHPLVRDRKEAP